MSSFSHTGPHIVRLDGHISPVPHFPPTFTHTYTSYDRTPPDTQTIISRLADANVAITTRVPISAETIAICAKRKLKLIAVHAIGYDMVDLKACKEHGIKVCNVPAASNEAVAEHAIALFFAVRRRVVDMHNLVINTNEWAEKGSLASHFDGVPVTCRQEVVGIIGVGELGNRVANIFRSLNSTVLLSERPSCPPASTRPGRTPFVTVLAESTVIIITVPLAPTTLNLISTTELSLMKPDAVLINVARGGIVDEVALVKALWNRKIAAAATDVFVEEPAVSENSVLIKAAKEDALKGRLVLSPHLAWFARSSVEKLRVTTATNIEVWARGGDEGWNMVDLE
ncbi:uncharacterized protein BP5553_09037 [Venustampulla echinocandica]|uniref:Glycerate dehydrogenase n=1 Tax=Venustampulla echinocandica TaxID=2656787 RepID=A0A370TDS4_9HELO|nr:uncharacterized protein BP5553_09037 [Venustampulla echinocandica]RDL32581.1 hypothetical protein BP5553_09037 [Venustampulla echinocandica]